MSDPHDGELLRDLDAEQHRRPVLALASAGGGAARAQHGGRRKGRRRRVQAQSALTTTSTRPCRSWRITSCRPTSIRAAAVEAGGAGVHRSAGQSESRTGWPSTPAASPGWTMPWSRHTATNFLSAAPESRPPMLDLIAYRKNDSPELGPGILFFDLGAQDGGGCVLYEPDGDQRFGLYGQHGGGQIRSPAGRRSTTP